MKMLPMLSSGILVLAMGSMASRAGDKKEEAPLVVPVSKAIQRSVTDFADYGGRARAKYCVTVQPRVSGYLVKVAFKEGSEVKAGDVLFEIDPRPYQAQAAGKKGHNSHDDRIVK